MQLVAWGFCGKRNIQMSFIKSIFSKFSKPLKSEDFIVHEDDENAPVELKANSGRIVKVYFFGNEKEILVSEDVAKILIERKKSGIMPIVNEDSLTGHFRVSLNKYELNSLNLFIERYEKKYLMDLFGPDIYATFIADLVGVPGIPQNTPFTTIFECFQICTPCGQRFNCDGLLDMLKGFIYYHWISEQWLKKTASGTTVIDSENSTVRASSKIGLANYYNDAVQNYQLIQLYICQNIELFETDPEIKFKGIEKEFMPLT